ncbi:22983_t:CDS:2, partial [Cetraspora pellucida]
LTDSNSISNSDIDSETLSENPSTSSDKTLSEDNISTDHNNNTDYTDQFDEDNGSIIKTKLQKNSSWIWQYFRRRHLSRKWKTHANCTVIIKTKKSPNGRECGQLVKTQGSTGNFQTYLNTHVITKPTKITNTTTQPTITEMFYYATKQNSHQKETIDHALTKWIVTNLQPLYVLQNESFIEFVHALNLYYELPSDKSVKALIHKTQELLKISKEQIDDNEQKFLHAISDTPTLTMNADTNYNIRKDAIYLKSLMITEEEWRVLEELTVLLAPFAKITELLNSSNYFILSFMWPAITTLTRNCEPILANIDEEINLISILTIFDEKEEEDIVNLDEELEIITTANGNKIKLSQPQDTDDLVEKVKEDLHKVLYYYWNILLNSSLIAMLLDPYCKSMNKLDSWEHDKAISLLQEEYNLLNTENETVTNLQTKEQNESQINLFSIMFRLDTTSTPHKNEIDKYLKIDQVPVTTDPLNWWKGIQQKLSTLAGLAHKYLAMPAISTPSEQLFLSTGNLMISKCT